VQKLQEEGVQPAAELSIKARPWLQVQRLCQALAPPQDMMMCVSSGRVTIESLMCCVAIPHRAGRSSRGSGHSHLAAVSMKGEQRAKGPCSCTGTPATITGAPAGAMR
jgi:hypothetical protein